SSPSAASVSALPQIRGNELPMSIRIGLVQGCRATIVTTSAMYRPSPASDSRAHCRSFPTARGVDGMLQRCVTGIESALRAKQLQLPQRLAPVRQLRIPTDRVICGCLEAADGLGVFWVELVGFGEVFGRIGAGGDVAAAAQIRERSIALADPVVELVLYDERQADERHGRQGLQITAVCQTRRGEEQRGHSREQRLLNGRNAIEAAQK